MLDASPELQLALQKVTTVAQVTVLAPASGAGADPSSDLGKDLILERTTPEISLDMASTLDVHPFQNSTPLISNAYLCAPRPGPLCVLNTHLFYHPYAPHIRTMHTAAILEEAAAFITSSSASIATAAPSVDPKDLALIFCGDFNSDLNEGIPGEQD